MRRSTLLFMLPEDERAFAEYVVGAGGVIVPLARRSLELQALPPEPEAWPHWPEDRAELCLLQSDGLSELSTDYYERIDRYVIDVRFSPVVRLMRSRIHEGRLLAGSLSAHLDVEVWSEQSDTALRMPKGAEFARFYHRLAGWIRRRYQPHPQLRICMGPAAWTWYEEGSPMRQG